MKRPCLLKRITVFLVVATGLVSVGLRSEAQYITVTPGFASPPNIYFPDFVYGPAFGLPATIGGGATVALFPPPPPFVGPPPPPPGAYFVDALTSGTEAGNAYLYSVAFLSLGLPGSPVAFESAVGTAPTHFFGALPPGPAAPPEVEGDIYLSAADFVTAAAHPTFGIPALSGAIPGAPALPPGYTDEFSLGLNVGDDIQGLMYRIPLAGVGTAYYSLSPTGILGPYSAADIIAPAGPLGVPWAAAAALSLVLADDIDALIVQDLGVVGTFDAADFVAFSLAPGSPTLAAMGFGVGAGGAEILVPDGPDLDLLPDIFIASASLGLLVTDNVDALDVVTPVPEPNVLLLLMVVGVALAVHRRRRFRG